MVATHGESENLRGRIEQLESEARLLRSENSKLRINQADFRSMIESCLAGVSPIPARKVYALPRRKGKAPRVTYVGIRTDWHLDERVRRDETGGFADYDFDIAADGLRDINARDIEHLALERNGFDIQDGYLCGLGDWTTADIHPDEARYNTCEATEGAAKAVDLWVEQALTYAPHFRHLDIVFVGGSNHARFTRKPQAKRASVNSWDFIVAHFTQRLLAAQPNITVHIPTDTWATVNIAGHDFILSHGNDVRSAGRTPYYGFSRHVSAELRRRLRAGMPAVEKVIVGHYHHYAELEDGQIMLCPSLIGPTEYSRKGGFPDGKPAQVSFLVGKHGAFGTLKLERHT